MCNNEGLEIEHSVILISRIENENEVVFLIHYSTTLRGYNEWNRINEMLLTY